MTPKTEEFVTLSFDECRQKLAQIALIIDGWQQPEPEDGWPEGELSDRQVLRWIAEVLT